MTAQERVSVELEQEVPSNEVFISYSRRDKDFVAMLDQTLRQHGHDPWVDWSDIQPAEDWWQAIERGIEAASTFVFVISPDSIASKVCRQEIEHGLRHNKRLVPLLWREGFSMEDVHPAISRHNWIFFRETDDFQQAFTILTKALKTDLEYVRTHTRLLVKAKEWQRKLLDTSFLLRGSDLQEAEQWLNQSNKQPPPTDLHRSYIDASQQEERARQEVELRLRQMSPQQYRNRKTLLSKVRNYWIQEVLENSLHDRVLLELGLEERMDAVAAPWYIADANVDFTPKPLPEGTQAVTLFDRLGEGRTLLILGEPGSGKTTTLLKLARDLVTRAEQGLDDRIPVVFNLSSWRGTKQSIDEWLVSELSTKYQIPSAIGHTWVETQQLLLLLDGLDEVKAENRNACVLALNTFQQQFGAEMVVSCRVQDYEVLKNRLNFQQAILVRSLTPEQIQHYIDRTGAEMTALKTLLERDVVLQELAQSPLMLNIMSLVYQGKRTADLPGLDLEAQRTYLFNSFIERMLKRRGTNDCYSKEQVIPYLVWLAQQMTRRSRSVFLIEELQPTWLPTPFVQRLYRVIVMGLVGILWGFTMGLFCKVLNTAIELDLGMKVGLLAGVTAGVAAGFLPKLGSNWSFGILSGLVATLIYGLTAPVFGSPQPLNMLIFGLVSGLIFLRLNHQHIEPADTVQWSWSKGKQKFIVGMAWGLAAGAMLLIFRLRLPADFSTRFCRGLASTESLAQWGGSVLIHFVCQDTRAITLNTLIGLLTLGTFVGFAISLILGFKKIPEVESRTIPNHGIWKSAKNAVTLIVICSSLSTLVSALFWLIYFYTPATAAAPSQSITSQVIWWIYYGKQQSDVLLFGLSVGVFMGLISGLVGGENSGLVILQHCVLRILLWRRGCIPWNYARFLNFAAERILLKKVGGSYIFIHRLLLEHFAQLHSGESQAGRREASKKQVAPTFQ